MPLATGLAKVLVQGAPTQGGAIQSDHCEFTMNAPGEDPPGEFDLLVDVHRTSVMALKFPVEKRVFATNESPLFLPYFTDLSNIPYLDSYYSAVLTNDVFLSQWPNARYANLHYRWATPRSEAGKKFGVSAMFSAKAGLPNYELRHKILENVGQIQIPQMVVGQSSKAKMFPLQCVWEHGSKDATFEYMFQFAIENCCSHGYFTEKIIDCFATCTVPIYLGAPDIGRYWNMDGIIALDVDNWVNQVNSLTPEDYRIRMGAIADNFERSKRYWSFMSALDAALVDNGLI